MHFHIKFPILLLIFIFVCYPFMHSCMDFVCWLVLLLHFLILQLILLFLLSISLSKALDFKCHCCCYWSMISISICPWVCLHLLDRISNSFIDCYVIYLVPGSISIAFPGEYSHWMVFKPCIHYDLPFSVHNSIRHVPFSFLLPSPYCPTMSSEFPSSTSAFKPPITRIISSSLHCRFASVISQ